MLFRPYKKSWFAATGVFVALSVASFVQTRRSAQYNEPMCRQQTDIQRFDQGQSLSAAPDSRWNDNGKTILATYVHDVDAAGHFNADEQVGLAPSGQMETDRDDGQRIQNRFVTPIENGSQIEYGPQDKGPIQAVQSGSDLRKNKTSQVQVVKNKYLRQTGPIFAIDQSVDTHDSAQPIQIETTKQPAPVKIQNNFFDPSQIQSPTVASQNEPARSTVIDKSLAGNQPPQSHLTTSGPSQSNLFGLKQQSKWEYQLQNKSANSGDEDAVDGQYQQVNSSEFTSQQNEGSAPALAAGFVDGGGPKPVTQGTTDYRLAGEPKIGDHWKDETPVTDKCAWPVPASPHDFSPDAIDPYQPYDPYAEMQVYQGKQLNANQRPLLEIGRPWYQLGPLSPGYSFLGYHNNVTPQFIVFGDFRTAVASNTGNDGDNVSQWAFELNLNLDLKLTSTGRFVGFVAPLDNGKNTRLLLDDDQFIDETDFDFDFGYVEGDLGAMVGGFIGETLPFDLPYAIGVMPLLVQNGVWLEDAFLGVAVTRPARNNAWLNISNMDITFFAGFDEIISPAFEFDDDAAKMYGFLSFIEALNGYFEIDYAYLEDRDTARDRSYHNIGFAYSRRYGRFVSNSTRIIVNAGQDTGGGPNTADGILLLSENSLITGSPYNTLPYLNFFAGFDRPQSAARAGGAGGVLRNTGILFESDGMTAYPTLDDTANDTIGAAMGLNLLAPDFSQQLIVEVAALGVMNNDPARNAPGDQYGLAFRYQLPLSNNVIMRVDGMNGFLRAAEDVRGLRLELRHKF